MQGLALRARQVHAQQAPTQRDDLIVDSEHPNTPFPVEYNTRESRARRVWNTAFFGDQIKEINLDRVNGPKKIEGNKTHENARFKNCFALDLWSG